MNAHSSHRFGLSARTAPALTRRLPFAPGCVLHLRLLDFKAVIFASHKHLSRLLAHHRENKSRFASTNLVGRAMVFTKGPLCCLKGGRIGVVRMSDRCRPAGTSGRAADGRRTNPGRTEQDARIRRITISLAFPGSSNYSSSSRSFASTDKSSSVVVSPTVWFPAARSLSKRRMIFPLRVFGNESVNRISSGLAKLPMVLPT